MRGIIDFVFISPNTRTTGRVAGMDPSSAEPAKSGGGPLDGGCPGPGPLRVSTVWSDEADFLLGPQRSASCQRARGTKPRGFPLDENGLVPVAPLSGDWQELAERKPRQRLQGRAAATAEASVSARDSAEAPPCRSRRRPAPYSPPSFVRRTRGAQPRSLLSPPLGSRRPGPKRAGKGSSAEVPAEPSSAAADESMPAVSESTASLQENMTIEEEPQAVQPPAVKLPPLPALCAARWQTLDYIPADVRREWTAAFVDSLRRLTASPSLETLTIFYMVTKAVLALPRRGGRSRQEAVTRLIKSRLSLFQSGRYIDLWEKVHLEHKNADSKKRAKPGDDEEGRRMKAVARLVDAGLVSKACSRLGSRGVAEFNEATVEKVKALFPPSSEEAQSQPCGLPLAELEVERDKVKLIVLSFKRGLAWGPSGLRPEHLRAPGCGRRPEIDDRVLDKLREFCSAALNGALPAALQPFLCAGTLVPLNKKDNGLRPLVVGEFLRSLVGKLACRAAAGDAQALRPLQVGAGGTGPTIQSAVLAARSWASSLGTAKVMLKVDVKNAFNTISRRGCLRELRSRCPALLPGHLGR